MADKIKPDEPVRILEVDVRASVDKNFDAFDFGRRIEANGTWTVYHVFSGIPARVNGRIMAGLNRAVATETMLWSNAGLGLLATPDVSQSRGVASPPTKTSLTSYR